MEAQMHRDPHDVGLQEEVQDQHYGEKKSVSKKVKEKAKKIKDTITKHGHDPGRIAEEYEEEEDQEIVNDPEIHGAPVYESTVIRSTNLPMQTDLNLENPTDRREDRYGGSKMARSVIEDYEPDRKNPPQHGPDSIGVEETEEPVFKIGPVVGLQEARKKETDTDPSNYQTKVTDPTGEGGKDADIVPLARRLDNLHVQDESESKTAKETGSYTGSHDQTVNKDQPGDESIMKSAEPDRPEAMPRDTITGKISSATAVVADTTVSAKNAVASKLGYGGGEHPEGHDSAASGKPLSSEYGQKVVQTLAPVYEKVIETGSTLVSKVGGGGGVPQAGGGTVGADKGVTVKEYLAEKLRPGDEDKALSDAIAEAFQKKKEPPLGLGRVTESPEVAARLGTGTEGKREGADALSAGIESTGGGVAERLKDAVGSWLGKSSGMETAQQSIGQAHVSGPATEAGDGRVGPNE